MKDINNLIERATEMKSNGMLEGQIADELNISRETVTWILAHASERKELRAPKDLSIDWSSIGGSSYRLRCISDAVADLILDGIGARTEIDTVVGIAVSGIPLASIVSNELGAKLAIFHPNKQLLGTETTDVTGIFSQNFADVNETTCVIVDDVITTGGTVTETVRQLTEMGAKPVAIAVLIDKIGQSTIEGVPVYSLLRTLYVA
ncbi:MAG: orotate phosphoribosyltransferase-like protein [Euryarchaeota archaeon]|nr:orotate phosphoribosyltransferase-like protein [Euryarchaeota archaeon]